LFNDIAKERADCVGEIERHVPILGGDPEKSGTAGGAVHRAWMNILGTFTGKTDHWIL
jgi:uncharacterized protein (TIGR02284 family)